MRMLDGIAVHTITPQSLSGLKQESGKAGGALWRSFIHSIMLCLDACQANPTGNTLAKVQFT
jgi:hypothetical protein